MTLSKILSAGVILACASVAPAHAQSASATVQAECSGGAQSQIAIRWGHPGYAGQPLMPLTAVRCGTGMKTVQLQVPVLSSEIEIQTEGGIETGYTVRVNIDGPRPGQSGTVTLSHQGSPSVVTRAAGMALRRSSGPNRYGEQNFRLTLPSATATARVIAQSSGNRGGAQMALRWGHPDFHDNEFFPLWTVPAGPAQEKTFRLTATDSEFEIQTEGGEGTGYHLSGWLDVGHGMGMQPSFESSHRKSGIAFSSQTGGGTAFRASTGNVYGEGHVAVTVPGLPKSVPVSNPGAQTLLFRLDGPISGAFAGVFGSGARGRITRLQNESMVPVDVVGTAGSSADCFKGTANTKVLAVRQATTDAEFAALFPQGLAYPARLVACAPLDGSVPNVGVVFLVTYVPAQ